MPRIVKHTYPASQQSTSARIERHARPRCAGNSELNFEPTSGGPAGLKSSVVYSGRGLRPRQNAKPSFRYRRSSGALHRSTTTTSEPVCAAATCVRPRRARHRECPSEPLHHERSSSRKSATFNGSPNAAVQRRHAAADVPWHFMHDRPLQLLVRRLATTLLLRAFTTRLQMAQQRRLSGIQRWTAAWNSAFRSGMAPFITRANTGRSSTRQAPSRTDSTMRAKRKLPIVKEAMRRIHEPVRFLVEAHQISTTGRMRTNERAAVPPAAPLRQHSPG